ncbi:transposase DNA-binding-containing protein [Mesorhizobium sp. M0898]|uniref:transposase DNA-binding-containing protein n=1 Tax=Mesorhizobium sp. M0898 TaxID=2957020 RepID=UPI003334D280
MREETSSSEAAWQEELCGAALPDKRVASRLQRLLGSAVSRAGQSDPGGLRRSAAKAAYRFVDNPRVTVLAGHFAPTAARVAANEGPILILEETTEFIYSRAQPGKIGFTNTVNAGRYKAGQPNVLTLCGVLMHSRLAVTLTGTPLGLTAAKFWTRTKFRGTLALKRHINPTRVPTETKESYSLAGVLASVQWRSLAHPSAACMWVTGRARSTSSIAPRRTLVPAASCGCRRTGWPSGSDAVPRSRASRLCPTCGGPLGGTSSH